MTDVWHCCRCGDRNASDEKRCQRRFGGRNVGVTLGMVGFSHGTERDSCNHLRCQACGPSDGYGGGGGGRYQAGPAYYGGGHPSPQRQHHGIPRHPAGGGPHYVEAAGFFYGEDYDDDDYGVAAGHPPLRPYVHPPGYAPGTDPYADPDSYQNILSKFRVVDPPPGVVAASQTAAKVNSPPVSAAAPHKTPPIVNKNNGGKSTWVVVVQVKEQHVPLLPPLFFRECNRYRPFHHPPHEARTQCQIGAGSRLRYSVQPNPEG